MNSYFKENLFLKYFGLIKVPLIGQTRPKITKLTDTESEVIIPLRRKSKNHLNSMYFAALGIGADTAVGILILNKIKKSGKKISFVFQEVRAEYHKRAEGDVSFICHSGEVIDELINKVTKSNERQSITIAAYATTPALTGDEKIASFFMTLSLKNNSRLQEVL